MPIDKDEEKILWGAGGAFVAWLMLRMVGWGPRVPARKSGSAKLPDPIVKGHVERPYLLEVSGISCRWEDGLPIHCINLEDLPDGDRRFSLAWNPPRPPWAGAMVEVDVTGTMEGAARAIEARLLELGWLVRLVSR